MKIIGLFILVIVSSILQACPTEYDETIDMYLFFGNNSNENIHVGVLESESSVLSYDFPQAPEMIIAKGGSQSFPIIYDHFKDNNKLYLFIYKESTLKNHTWQEIQDKNLYDKKYELTLDQMKAHNFKIIYDGA